MQTAKSNRDRLEVTKPVDFIHLREESEGECFVLHGVNWLLGCYDRLHGNLLTKLSGKIPYIFVKCYNFIKYRDFSFNPIFSSLLEKNCMYLCSL